MTTTQASTPRLDAQQVHETLRRHMLADGYEMVLDLERSRGAHIHDARSGRDLLDFFGNFSTVALGLNHPCFDDPEAREQLLRTAINKPANSDLYTVEMAEFVSTFARTLPPSLRQHLFFIEGGAMAVENAMKAAFDWKVRKNLAAGRGELGSRIVHFREAFHGRSGYTLSVTNTDLNKILYFPKFDWPRVINPKLRFPVTAEVIADVERVEEQAIEQIQQALVEHRHDVAAILLEPIQAEGGDNHFRPEFLRRLREIADQEDVLLIFDEVQTGFGTTGKWWCFEHFGIEPDIVAFGKKTQVCGIAASRRLDEVESVFQVSGRINSTWGGSLVDMVRCRIIVETMERDGLVENAARVGQVLLGELRALEGEMPHRLGNVRGLGLFLAIELPSAEARKAVLAAMRRHGLLGLSSGERSIRFRPPLVLDERAAREGVERTRRALVEALPN
ncbi:MAG TPA: L-lysine 6-transaminase [Thermoanaerobaculia bacterium]|nr:L-lysine 6-transaminase [Thermoanaerobaculia bacterium]